MGANTLTLGDVNNTAASFTGSGMIDAGANQTFSAADALSSFTGTVSVNANTLTLGGINNTAAAITGSGVIDADANQVFTGDVSGFTGSFDIKAGTEVQLNGTFGSTINAFGGTLTLADKGVAVTVNGMTGLADLNFGNNSLTLGTGLFDSVNGTGSVVFDAAHTDNSFTSLTAGSVTLTDGRDIEATEFDGNLYITINSAATSNVADLTTGSTLNDAIYVTIDDASKVAGGYKVVTAGGYAITGIQLWNDTLGAYVTLSLNDGVKVGGYTYTLREEGLTWVLNQLSAYSNIVYVNADWTGKDKYQQVIDPVAGDLSIGYNAAKDLASAVSYIRAWTTGSGWNNDGNLQEGDAKIELTAGKYTLSSGTLMTAENEVKQMYVVGRNGEKAVLSGAINGSDGSKATTLTLENVTIQGEVYGGGKLVIQNGAGDRATGNVIAAGINATADATMTNASELVINGGNFGTRSLVGGSVNSGTGTLTVDGATSLVIDNTSGEKLVISSNIYGGSWAESGKVVQNGNANITINAVQETQIRGNIYVSGGAANGGVLEMNGNSTITFTGDASKLTFTGSVNATQSAKDEIVVFNDFTGKFNGSFNGFDSITISGSTALEFTRRQTKTDDTALNFVVNGRTGANAMYTVRDANNWEFDTVISIDATSAAAGEYVLVDNYVGGYEGFTFTLNGQNYTLGSVVNSSIITVVDDKLVLSVYDSNTNIVGSSTEQVVIDSQSAAETLIVGNVTSTESVAVDVTKENATVTNSGSVSGADIEGKDDNALGGTAVKLAASNTELVNEGDITASDVKYSAAVVVAPTTSGSTITNSGTIAGGDAYKSKAIQIGNESKKDVTGATVVNSGDIIAADAAGYNCAIHAYSKDFTLGNSGTISGDIYVQGSSFTDIANSGTITAMTTTSGRKSVVTSNGLITLSGNGGTYELVANTETGNFNGEIVEGDRGIRVTANNTTFKAGNDTTVGNADLKGFANDSGKNIEISGDNNSIQLASKKDSYGIYEYSYDSNNTGSDVIISGDNNTIAVNSASKATGIFARNGAVVITGSGVEITATGSYAYGIETKDVKNYSGDVIIGTFNDDGSVAQASDIQLTVSGASSSTTGILAAKGNVQVALAADGKIESSHIAISAESIQISNAGTIIGDVKATGTGTNDSITIGVDAVLNGKISGVETLSVTGISSLTTDVAGAKAVTGSVDSALANVKLDNVDSVLGTAKQIAGTATTETDDDVWASLDKLDNGNLVVSWGRSEAEVGAAFDAFKADSTLAIGDALVADVASLANGADVADFDEKKTNGTLA